MTLPPFPFLPASPEERLRLTQYGELVRAMYKDDAERYRWLRDAGATFYVDGERKHVCEWAMDAAVDAARSGGSDGGQQP